MTPFPEWLGQLDLAHLGPILQTHGIDLDSAARLSVDDLRRLGLNPADSHRLLRAIASRRPDPAASRSEPAVLAAHPPAPMLASGERRQQLTVMFCDLVGSTVLSHRLDPEELRDVMQAFITACCGKVQHYDGYVAQVLGDGLLIYFGWPAAHEDDAERCVRSALEIVEAVKAISAIEPLAVRIGVATGQVVVGGAAGTGGGAAGLAVGEAPNIAARLQSLARANQVVIAHATRTLLGDAFELTDLGALPLAGLGPSRAWEVQAVRRAAGRFDAAHGSTALSALVGRKEELALLVREWQLARSATGRAVMIGGEPGIGKSRLTEVLRESIACEPHTTLRYQCSPFHLNAAWYPVIAQIELAAGFGREDSAEQRLDKLEGILVGSPAQRAESAALLAALLSLPTERYAPLGLSALRQKEKTLEVLLTQVEVCSQINPVLMVVEDAHWIDPTSQELFDALVARMDTLPIMLLLTYRPQQYTPSWTEFAHVTNVTLTGLAFGEGAELAHNIARGKTLPAAVLEQLVVRADGVPLYLEELTKSVLESRLLLEEADRYTLLEPLQALAIPTSLSALLIARLDRRAGARELAQIGACIGRVFSYELLAAVSAQKGRDLDDELEQLTRTELVFRRGTPPDATYVFKHALVQDAAYDSLLRSRRQQLHARIADVLAQEFPQSVASQPELLAHHRTEAGHLTAAIPLWRSAGESALERMELREAVAYLEKGLAIVDRLPPSADRDGFELSLREPLHSARLRWHGWGSSEVGVNATAILWLAQKQRRPQSLLIGLWGMWINTITQGRVAETPDWARRLLAEGTQSGDIDLHIFGHRARLSSHFYLGEHQQALEQRDKILALYDPRHARRWMELSGNDTRTAVGVFASQSLWMLGYPDQAAQLSSEKDADARWLGDPFDIGWALTWGGYVFDYRCEPDRLLASAAEAERHGREQSIPLLSVLVPMIAGLALLRHGQLPEAIASLRAGIEGWRLRGGHLNLPYLKSALAEALARSGDLDAAVGLLNECQEQIERPGWHERVWLPETLRLKGWVLMQQGRPAEAEAQLRASIEWARRQMAKSWELRSSTALARILIDGNRREAARELLTPVYQWFTEGFETHDLKAARSLLEELR